MARRLIGAVIRSIRLDAGMGQNELAERIGITAPYLNNIEKGRKYGARDPSLPGRVAAALGVDESVIAERDPHEAAAS